MPGRCSDVGIIVVLRPRIATSTSPVCPIDVGSSKTTFWLKKVAAASDIQDLSLSTRTLDWFSKVTHPLVKVEVTQFSPDRVAVRASWEKSSVAAFR